MKVKLECCTKHYATEQGKIWSYYSNSYVQPYKTARGPAYYLHRHSNSTDTVNMRPDEMRQYVRDRMDLKPAVRRNER